MDGGDAQSAVDTACECLKRADLRDGHWRRLNALLGKALERLGQYDDAFAAYSRAAEYERFPFDLAAYIAEVDALMRFFTRQWFERCPRSGLEDDDMVFVVGMPRSGSTLVERILDSHPQIRAVGEHPGMYEVIEGIKLDINLDDPWPERIRRLSPAMLARLGREYLAAVRGEEGGSGNRPVRVVDKSLWNRQALGLIAMLLPRSRVVWTQRNPEDSCLSCYAESLDPAQNPFGSDLRNLGAVHVQSDRLLRHWQEVLPIPIHVVQYEDLVADQAGHTRALLEFVNVPWSDDCLEFYRKATPSGTKSHAQVRRPIYDSSIGRAARFHSHLGPLREALAAGEQPNAL